MARIYADNVSTLVASMLRVENDSGFQRELDEVSKIKLLQEAVRDNRSARDVMRSGNVEKVMARMFQGMSLGQQQSVLGEAETMVAPESETADNPVMVELMKIATGMDTLTARVDALDTGAE